MSTERRPFPEPFYGETDDWQTGLRNLLRYVRTESPTQQALFAWTRDNTAASDGDIRDRLAFLESVALLDIAEETCTLGRSGREFLDTHDQGVLYDGLTATVVGFEELLNSLAIRPLTDVELRDLLVATLDEDVEPPESARPHRRWLQALGYLTHDDGVNEVTRLGRKQVDADGGLKPPGGEAPAEPAEESTQKPSSPNKAESHHSDTSLTELYDDTCMVCGDRRRQTSNRGFSHVHYLMPPGDHGGPEDPDNAVVVCPNHRADLEHGLITVDPQTLTIDHAYEPDISGRTLKTVGDHELGAQYLAYHNDVVAAPSD